MEPSVWTFETVETLGEVQQPKIAVDGRGALHVVYYDTYAYSLRYATNEDGVWRSELLDEEVTTYESNVVVGPDETVHVDYGMFWGPPRVARRAGGTWDYEELDALELCHAPSMAIDEDGALHLACVKADGYMVPQLVYATDAGGAWEVVEIASSRYMDEWPTIAIGNDGVVRVAYGESPDVLLARGGLDGFDVEVLDTDLAEFATARSKGLAVTADGATHVAYVDSDFGGYDIEVRYATDRWGGWFFETVDTGGGNTQGPTLQAAADGSLYLLYQHAGGPAYEMRWASDVCGCWQVESGWAGARLGALSLDPLGGIRAALVTSVYLDEYTIESEVEAAARPEVTCDLEGG